MNPDPKQPLYVAPEERVTLEQLKHRAETITDLATSETKRVASEVAEQNLTKAAIVVVGVVLVTVSVAYFLGTRAGRRRASVAPYGG
jgi:hypothetical protein